MPKFSPAYNDSPALTDGQKKKLPDAVQKAIAKKKLRAIRDKEKAAFIVPAAVGAVSGDDPVRGALGGVVGGTAGALAALPVSLGAMALAAKRNPKVTQAIKASFHAKKGRLESSKRFARRKKGLEDAAELEVRRFAQGPRPLYKVPATLGTIGGAYVGGKALGKKKEASAITSYMDKVAYRPGVPYMGSKGFGKGTASGVVTSSQAHQATRTGGMPGYDKGGPVKKDGYLTDKKLKPYARVHKGEMVMPKEKKAFALYMDKIAGVNLAPFVLPAAVGAVSAKDSPAKGAAGGIVGGALGSVAGLAAGLGISAPAALALVRASPELAGLVAGVGGGLGAVSGQLYGAHKGGKHFGSTKTKKASAFSSYMDKVAGHAVMGQGYLKSMNDDHHMLCKSLESMIAQAEYLKGKLNEGLILPSWAEYKVYKAYDAISSAVSSSFPGEYLKVEHD